MSEILLRFHTVGRDWSYVVREWHITRWISIEGTVFVSQTQLLISMPLSYLSWMQAVKPSTHEAIL